MAITSLLYPYYAVSVKFRCETLFGCIAECGTLGGYPFTTRIGRRRTS